MKEYTEFMSALFKRSGVVLYRTEMKHPELHMLQLGDAAFQLRPEKFAGKRPAVYYKFRYTAPCDQFAELRRLICEVQDAKGLRAAFKGMVAVDVSEWYGREKEEYFEVLLKYLYDHRASWYTVLVLCSPTQRQTQAMMKACSQYIKPYLVGESPEYERDVQTERIREIFKSCDGAISNRGLDCLAETLQSLPVGFRDDPDMLQRMVEELLDSAEGDDSVGLREVNAYLENENTVLGMYKSKERDGRR